MKLLQVICLLSLVAINAAAVIATPQIPERLRYAGREYLMYSEPLEQRYAAGKSRRPPIRSAPYSGSSALERGYVATWEIRKDGLYLVDIDSWVCGARSGLLDIPCRRAMLEDILGPVVDERSQFAAWFTGELRVPQGRQLLYVHLPYRSIYERDVIFQVQAGVVKPPVTIDNTKKALPPEYRYTDRRSTPLGSFDIAASPPNLLDEIHEPITAGMGLRRIMLGASQSELEAVLGRGETLYLGYQAVNETYIDYGDSSVQIRYDLPAKTAAAIYFINRATRTRHLKTERGIGFSASVNDLLSAHGEPIEIRRILVSETSPAEAVDYCYPGIEFRFENNKLNRIAVVRSK